jgi:DMSO/TMAO reductase YedYZ heme-binding membrane subunit
MLVAAQTPTPAAPRAGPFRLSLRGTAVLVTMLGLIAIYATGQILPASSDRQAELRFWLAARATGIVVLVLLTLQVAIGLVLSHPHNKTTWKLSRTIFPWHDHLWVFVFAFLAIHIVSLVVDPKAGVSLSGAFIPGLSQYRSAPVALGTLALYAFLVTALTARYTKLLPPGFWLSLHRLAVLIFVLSWLHGLLAGTDSEPLRVVYLICGAVVLAAGAYRYWASRRSRPTFSTSRTEANE